jgi:YVTN family beta-propeller protein
MNKLKYFLIILTAMVLPVTAFTQQMGEPTGTVWVANGMEDSLSAIDLATGKIKATLSVGTNPHILSTSPEGDIVYIIKAGEHDRVPGAHGESIEKMPVEKTQMGHQASQENITSENHGDSGKFEHMGMEKDVKANSLWAMNAVDGTIIARVAVGQGPTHPIPSPDGRWIYVTNTDDDSVSVIDTKNWKIEKTITNLPEPHDGELSPDGRLLYLATAGNNTVTVLNTLSGKVVWTFDVGTKPRGLTIGGLKGEIVYVTNKGDGTLSIIDVPANRLKATISVGKGAHAVRVSPDQKTIYVALSKEDSVAVIDARKRKVIKKIPVGSTPEQIDLSHDGRLLFSSNNGDSTVSVIDVMKGRVIATVQVGKGAYGVQAVNTKIQLQQEATQMTLPSFPKNKNGYSDITVRELENLMDNHSFTLVNVHIPYEGEIPRTDRFIPFNRVADNLDLLPDKEAPIVLYCRSGSMSTKAARDLAEMGYMNILELDGGFNAWKAQGNDFKKKL